ncbi:MAG: hypothetical protein ACE5HR_00030 [bacterium]
MALPYVDEYYYTHYGFNGYIKIRTIGGITTIRTVSSGKYAEDRESVPPIQTGLITIDNNTNIMSVSTPCGKD